MLKDILNVVLFAGVLLGTPAANAVESQRRSMSYGQCLEMLRQTSSKLGTAPVNIVETPNVRIVRFCTADGSVLVTCAQGEAVITISEKRC
jgi:hypothetical protein